jgi:hypothetical protein
VTRDDYVIDLFRSCGRSLRGGTPVRAPQLPRTRRTRMMLQLEADRDQDVRVAYGAALDQAAQTEQARQLEPRVLRRACGTILEIR